MFRIYRITYYLKSIIRLVKELRLGWPLRFKNTGLSFRIGSLLDLLVLKEVLIDDDYKIANISNRPVNIVDVGAGFGDYSITVAKGYPKSKVFCFEPDDKYHRLLETNISENKIVNIITNKTPIKSITDIFEITKLKHIDILKVDCEGAEYEIFSHGKQKLNLINNVVMEYHNTNFGTGTDLKKLLLKSGFIVSTIDQQRGISNLGLLYASRTFEK